jgi:hypothetical protein
LQKGSAIQSEARLHPGLLAWTLSGQNGGISD